MPSTKNDTSDNFELITQQHKATYIPNIVNLSIVT